MVLYTTIPYIAEKTGVVTSNIIAAIGIGSLIFSFMGPFWAAKSDKLGRKKVLSFGMFGLALSFTLLSCLFLFNDYLPLWSKISLVFMSRIIYGLLCSSIVPVSQAWQLDLYDKTDHLKILTRNSMCLNLGRILGPILILIKKVDFELVIYSATLWGFLLAIFVFFTSSSNHTVRSGLDFKLIDIIENWKRSIKESIYPILLAMIFTSFVGILHSFLGHHLKTVLSISGADATMMFAKIILVLSFVVVLMQQVSLYVLKSHWKPRVIIGSFSIVIGTVIMMKSTTELMIWISIFFVCIATALIPPAYLSLTSRSEINTDKTNVFGKKLGLASIAHSFGYAVGAGLIAISMKSKLIPESFVVFFVSFSILCVSFLMLRKKENSYVKNY